MTGANANLIDRAFRAYVAADGSAAEQPTLSACSVESICGRRYVALRNHHRMLAVYRIRRCSGCLRRLRVWPIDLMGREPERPTIKLNPTGEGAYV